MRIAPLLAVASLFLTTRTFAQQITIVESTSFLQAHTMDTTWFNVATDMGYTPQIVPQSGLDDIANLAATDVLIISSGVISLTTTGLNTLYQFAQSGRPCFVQSEYLTTAGGSITFHSLMAALSADFQWIGSQSGDLAPVMVNGTLATTPNAVDTLDYFWYGCAGGGTDVQSFLDAGGYELGWVHAADASGGLVITTTDQDWVKEETSFDLMENILFMLAGGASGIAANDVAVPVTIQPSIVDDHVLVQTILDTPCTVILRDTRGSEMLRATVVRSATLELSALRAGPYVYEVRTRDGRAFAGKLIKR